MVYLAVSALGTAKAGLGVPARVAEEKARPRHPWGLAARGPNPVSYAAKARWGVAAAGGLQKRHDGVGGAGVNWQGWSLAAELGTAAAPQP